KKEKSRRMSNKKDIDTAFLSRTIELLETVLDEFDPNDADHDEALLKTAFSTLIKEGYMTVSLKGFGLRDLVGEVLGEHASDDLIYRTETFDNLLDTYAGEPSDEDMEEAHGYLEKILNSLKKKVKSVQKRKDTQQTLWKNS
ncbi:MAG TPA: hypothetical protein VN911_12475, partial [Candidatus Acidoferrum sp.]|nr:hypothetical protein [Candidatus Acidoferrum sp.]